LRGRTKIRTWDAKKKDVSCYVKRKQERTAVISTSENESGDTNEGKVSRKEGNVPTSSARLT